MHPLIIGVLALQGAFIEHIQLLQNAAKVLARTRSTTGGPKSTFTFLQVRTAEQLTECDALIIPGGESTTISLVAADSGLLEPLRDFVKLHRKPTWGTCAGLILLAEAANRTKRGGQELIGGLDVRVNRNHFGRQVESFQADLDLPFLAELDTEGLPNGPFPGVFIRAPIVERILPTVQGPQKDEARRADTVVAPSRDVRNGEVLKAIGQGVKVLAVLPGRRKRVNGDIVDSLVGGDTEAGDIVAVQQGNVFGTSFHPELTSDVRIHVWWMMQVLQQHECLVR